MVGRRSIRQWVMRPFTAQEVASAFKAIHAPSMDEVLKTLMALGHARQAEAVAYAA